MNSLVHKTLAYTAYGMPIHSQLALPELGAPMALRTNSVPLRIVNATVDVPDDKVTPHGGYFFDETGSTFWWDQVGKFHVSTDGTIVRVERADGVSDELLAFPLLGPVFSEVLRYRGFFVLHASAVSIDGIAVAVMADKGVGKSSSAAALLRGGAALLADDLVAVDADRGDIVPGFAQIKLSEGNLGHQLRGTDWVVRPHVHDQIDKVRVRVPSGTALKHAPLRRLYVLERGEGRCATFVRVPPEEALPLLLRFAYAPRFGDQALRGENAARHFRAAVKLCSKAEVRRLQVSQGIEKLDHLIDAIRADLVAE
ncbi:hypothetical protein [Sagittula sp. S175]|uniref:hypothetical protein n=1 Tax=Sagittula sp. S175 TaxID=3415129 RepID=UPI003C79FB0C